MGIKTELSLHEAQKLFPQADLLSLQATDDGVIDTSYKAVSKDQRFILKKYETANVKQIEEEARLLLLLRQHHLLVPTLLDRNKEWYLFSYIEGESFKRPHYRQLKDLGRFMGKFHRVTYKKESWFTPFAKTNLGRPIRLSQKRYPHLSKKLQKISFFDMTCDGIIHGDLFTDNAKHNGSKLGVFDFIEAGNGSFALDLGIAASSWALLDQGTNPSRLNLLLKSYNQVAPKKIDAEMFLDAIAQGLLIYIVKRIYAGIKDKNSRLKYQTLYQRYTRFESTRIKMKKVLYYSGKYKRCMSVTSRR